MLSFERRFWELGLDHVAGVDEAGRGPLAGPVVAGAVIIEPAFALREEHGLLHGLTDSKQLTSASRERFFALLHGLRTVQIGVGSASVEEIDTLNILKATHLAMARAVAALPVAPQHILVDGLPVQGLPCESTPIVAGDAQSLSIAAASIIAKVTRDRQMQEWDALFPRYGFAKHKGYGTQSHIQALFEYGPSAIHRRTFRPVREAAEIRRRMA